MECRDPKIERLAGLTAADRKWMDEIVKDENETYDDDPTSPAGMQSVPACSLLFIFVLTFCNCQLQRK